jgi:polar amino acid transport system substrate-binding protein
MGNSRVAILSATAVAGLLLVAFAGSAAARTDAPRVQPPHGIKSAGKIVYCSDITYPPEEFYAKGSTNPEGSDVDIGKRVAKLMGVKAQFDNTGFDGIIPALLSKKCDAIISGMNDTPQRRKQVGFVDYLRVGQSLMVRKGNPDHISNLASLSGKSVSVELGTTNAAFLEKENTRLSGQGKAQITIVTFPKDTDAATALKTGRVQAYFGDSPVVAWYITRDRSSFAFAGQPINPIPVGIAIRKDDPQLHTAVQKAVRIMYRDGSMKRILAHWHMTAFALGKK